MDEQEPKFVVTSFAQLVPDGIYTYFMSSREAFLRVLGESRHLQQSREDEFARALLGHVCSTHPDQVRIQRVTKSVVHRLHVPQGV